jgi:hypothetical protein
MTVCYATKRVAICPTHEGYATTYTAAANEAAASWAVEQNRRHGFSSRTVAVSPDEHLQIMVGRWNCFQGDRKA